MPELDYKNRYSQILFLEHLIARLVLQIKKAAPRFELGIKDLQSSALPLGHAADKELNHSINDFNSKSSKSLLIICNGHGEDVIALEIIKRFSDLQEFENIEIMPLVGNGYIFGSIKDQKFSIVGKQILLPSGGFSNQNLKALLLDIFSGMPINILTNWLFVFRRSKKQYTILAIGDLLPLFFAWTSNCKFGFIGTPKSDYTWTSGPGWQVSDFYHKIKGSEWDPWEIHLMRSSNCKTVIVRDEMTANNLIKKKVNANYFGNPMMDFVESKKYKNNTLILDEYRKIILLIGSRYPEALNNLDRFLNCLSSFSSDEELLILLPLSLNAKTNKIEDFLQKFSYQKQKEDFPLGQDSTWRRNNQCILLGVGNFNDWANLADVGLANAGTATEQISGLGIPSLSLPGKGPQFTKSFAKRQQRLLGGSVYACRSKEEIVEKLKKLLNDKMYRNQKAKLGVERMGKKGASRKIAEHLTKSLF